MRRWVRLHVADDGQAAAVPNGVQGRSRTVLAETEALVAGLSECEATVGRLLDDDALYEGLVGTVAETEVMVRAVRQSAERLEGVVARLGGREGDATRLMADACEAATLARNAMADIGCPPRLGRGEAPVPDGRRGAGSRQSHRGRGLRRRRGRRPRVPTSRRRAPTSCALAPRARLPPSRIADRRHAGGVRGRGQPDPRRGAGTGWP